MAINRSDADAGLLRNLPYRSIDAGSRKRRHGGLKQGLDVALGVGAHRSILPAATRRTTVPVFRLSAHYVSSCQTERCSVYNWNAVPLAFSLRIASQRWPQINAQRT